MKKVNKVKHFSLILLLALGMGAAETTLAADSGATAEADKPEEWTPPPPPPDEFDWIQLTSGEWLKGELIGLFNDEVVMSFMVKKVSCYQLVLRKVWTAF